MTSARTSERGCQPSLLAAGGVLLRHAPSVTGSADLQVAVVHRPKRDDWSLPKGKAAPGEPLLLTARREVREETGQTAGLGMPLPGQRYVVGTRGRHGRRIVKDVHFWAMWNGAGDFESGPEVDEMRWLTLPEARRQLTYDRDVHVLDAVATVPAVTSTVVLTRSCGVERCRGTLRLDASGRQRADLLRRALPSFGRPALLAAHERSAATLRPSETEAAAECVVDPDLGRAPGIEVLQGLVAAAGTQPVVLSAPGQVVREVLEAAARTGGLADPAPLRGRRVRTRRGGLWVLSWHQAALVGVQYFPSLAGPAVPQLTITCAVPASAQLRRTA